MYKQVEKPKENKSRTVTNNVYQKKKYLKQSFGMVNSPRKPMQMVEDLDILNARVLSVLRSVSENELWKKDERNSEVQVSLDEEGVLTVGYNVGGTNTQPDLKVANDKGLPKRINDKLYKALPTLKNVWIKKVKVVNPTIVIPNQGRSVHAEQMIILATLQEMVKEIENGIELKHRDLNIRGKKYTCNECDRLIQKIDSEPALRRFLSIHTPTIERFDLTKENTDHEATQQSNSKAWENPLLTGLDTKYAKTQALKIGNNIKPGLDSKTLLSFIQALDEIILSGNP